MIKNKSGIWSFLASIQLAIILLFLIAFFALIGTLVPQREAAEAFAGSLSPKLFSFLQQLQIFDLYHSAWFFLLSGFLAVNLLICSLDRFPLAWRRYRTQPDPQNTGVFENLPDANRFSPQVDVGAAADAAEKLLKKKYHGFHREFMGR